MGQLKPKTTALKWSFTTSLQVTLTLLAQVQQPSRGLHMWPRHMGLGWLLRLRLQLTLSPIGSGLLLVSTKSSIQILP